MIGEAEMREMDAEREAAKLGAVGVVPSEAEGVQFADPSDLIAVYNNARAQIAVRRDELAEILEEIDRLTAEGERALEGLRNALAE